jgi:alkane 1-monooxygenase
VLSLPSARRSTTAYINSRRVTVNPRETLLEAALREGIAFPHSCRVGGCASCKCRLVSGRVKERTETGYLLSGEEIDQGVILACQSVPLSDVRIDVVLRRPSAAIDHDSTQRERLGPDPRRARDRQRASPSESGVVAAVIDVLHYLKFFLFHVVGLFSVAAILAGGVYTTLGLAAVLAAYVVGDAVCGEDRSTPRFRYPGILTAQLWLALPLLALIVYAALWRVSPGDPLGFGTWVTRLTGYDAVAARGMSSPAHLLSTAALTGLMIGLIGTVTAHELIHRTRDPVSMLIGRWLLAFSFDTSFAIEHVYGHHRYVATEDDPATAPRGRNVYFHVVASTLEGNASAWRIEAMRLGRRHRALYSRHNAVLRGHLMSALLLAGAWAMGGWTTALFFAACALCGKALLEVVNYMEHYGIVRDPATPVKPRHSWNSTKRVSSWTMFNLTRHSHHHAQGEVPYHDLKPFPNAPVMINGYLTTLAVALVPPLWHRMMTPRLLAWDRDYASPAERRLAARANASSAIPALKQAGTAAPAA